MAGNVLFIKDYFKLQNNTYPVLAVSIHQQDKYEIRLKAFTHWGYFIVRLIPSTSVFF